MFLSTQTRACSQVSSCLVQFLLGLTVQRENRALVSNLFPGDIGLVGVGIREHRLPTLCTGSLLQNEVGWGGNRTGLG